MTAEKKFSNSFTVEQKEVYAIIEEPNKSKLLNESESSSVLNSMDIEIKGGLPSFPQE